MGKIKYINRAEIKYWSKRYKKWITVPLNYLSDGATFACDIYSDGWWVHDKLCDTGMFDDGTRCTNWQASCVLSDILKAEGRWCRRWYWKWFTFAAGGGKARDNGMFKLKEK